MPFRGQSWPSMVSQSWGVPGKGRGQSTAAATAELQPTPADAVQCSDHYSSWPMTPKLSSSENLFIKLKLRLSTMGMACLCSVKSEAPTGKA